eukprot:TRINITY_DN55743_c0_g1_i1.p1 TRINITY_DN55743_c0_g1~~TRINITY_DN55743_c0_g1_i1.p1  ORF type:complete len:437 (+),score=207.90 TRINITY_DN55743_c0_g1_i1:109-1419(+)
MGALVSGCASCVASCCGSCLGAGCCMCLRNACSCGKGGRLSRLPYMSVFAVSVLFMIAMRYWFNQDFVVDLFLFDFQLCSSSRCAGNEMVYRISFTMFLFFLVHALMMMAPSCTFIHKRAWGVKIVLLIVVTVLVLWIDNSFFDLYSLIARFASFIFLLLQVVLLIDLGYRWDEAWGDRDRKWLYALLFSSVALYAGSITISVFGIGHQTTDGSCDRNKFLWAWVIILAIVTTVISGTAWCDHGRLIPSGVVTLYAFFLTYYGLLDDTSECNDLKRTSTFPLLVGLLFGATTTFYVGWSISTSSALFGVPSDDDANVEEDETFPEDDGDAETGGVQLSAVGASKVDADDDGGDDMTEDARSKNMKFHWIMVFASMYFAMLVTAWDSNTDSSEFAKDMDSETMWIKITSAWFAMLLYLWTLVAPMLLPDRFEFMNND